MHFAVKPSTPAPTTGWLRRRRSKQYSACMPSGHAAHPSTNSLSATSADFQPELAKAGETESPTLSATSTNSLPAAPTPSAPSTLQSELGKSWRDGRGPTVSASDSAAPRHGAFPASRFEAEVVAALRSRFEDASANRRIPADMLFGFVRSNEPRGFRGGAAPANAAQAARRWAEAAAKHLAEALTLLESFQIDRLAPQPASPGSGDRLGQVSPEAAAAFDEAWPCRVLGADEGGRIVVLDCVGAIRLEKLLAELGSECALRCAAERVERLRLRKLSLAESMSESVSAYYHTTIVDLRGLSASLLSRRNRAFLRRAFAFASICYPETVHRIFLTRAPAGFSFLYKAIRPWLDQDTATKVRLVGAREARALLKPYGGEWGLGGGRS